jgi:ABC-type uncharacterized transport system involved in gliding motility auxiliary subunit
MYYAIWVITECLLILSCISLWIVAPDLIQLNLAVTLFTFFLGLILFYPRRSSLQVWLQSRNAKNAVIHIAELFLIGSILSLISYLAWKFPLQIDMTERALNSLSDQSVQVLKTVPKDTKMTFYGRRQDWPRAMALLKLYRDVRNDLVLSAIDPELNPQQARSVGVQDNSTVIIEAGDKKIKFSLRDELSITNAFLKLNRSHHLNIYMSWGHGEASCDSTGADGISAFCNHLKNQNFKIHRLDLQKTVEIPTDADLVIIWGETAGFLPQEIIRLQRWLEKGGSLLWLYAPQFEQDISAEMRGLIKKWGIVANNDLVIDQRSTLENKEATILLIEDYARNHPITKGFVSRSLFPLTSSLDFVIPLYQNVATTSLLKTTAYPSSWAEKDLVAITKGSATYDPKTDKAGPISIAAVAERVTESPQEKDTRVGVIGNDSFLRNAYQNQTANINLALNMISWLAHDEGLVSLNRPGLAHEPVILSAQHLRFVFVITVISVPMIAFILALLIYRRRRKL